MQIKYFDSQVLKDEYALEEEKALQKGFYNKVYIENNNPVKSEFYSGGNVERVVYFNQDAKNSGLIDQHLKIYGNIEFEICNPFKENDLYCQYRFYFNAHGVLTNYWLFKGKEEWNWDEEVMFSPAGEKKEIVKTIYNEEGDPVKEVHYRGDGSFWFETEEDDIF